MKYLNGRNELMDMVLEFSDLLHYPPVDLSCETGADCEADFEDVPQEYPMEKPMQNKHRRTRRERELHIQKKEQIIRNFWTDSRPHEIDAKSVVETQQFQDGYPRSTGWWWNFGGADHRGELDKGKLHCSCPKCRAKTRNKGKRRKGTYSPSFNPSHRDIQRINAMDADEAAFYFGGMTEEV